MTLELFVSIVVASATATVFAIQLVKFLLDKFDIAYKTTPVAVIVAFIIGAAEIIIYTINNGVNINAVTILYAICAGVGNVIGSNCGYDKFKQFVYSLMGKTE